MPIKQKNFIRFNNGKFSEIKTSIANKYKKEKKLKKCLVDCRKYVV